MRLGILTLVLLTISCGALAQEPAWREALGAMPLPAGTGVIDKSNVGEVLTSSFRSNAVVKALILMPMAQEEFFLHRRARATLAASSPTLLDAVTALTEQSRVQVKFEPPFLLLHTDADLTEVAIDIQDRSIVEELKAASFAPHVAWVDRNWDHLLPTLRDYLPARVRPIQDAPDSWHFWRHTLAAWNLTDWEAVQAVALAGKTRVTLKRASLIRTPIVFYEPDRRPSAARINSVVEPAPSSPAGK